MADTTRGHLASLVVGRKRTGKSTYTNKLAKDYAARHPGKKVLIIDVNGSPAYKEHQQIDREQFKRWNKGIKRFYESDHEEMFAFITQHFRNGLIIFEDCTKYIDPLPSRQIKTFLVDHRMWDADLVFTFHSLMRVPKFFWEMTAYIVLKKTQDEEKELLRRPIPNKPAVLAAWRRVQAHKSEYHDETVETLI
jgi:hypothetical protein